VRSDEPGPGKTVWFVLHVGARPLTRLEPAAGTEPSPPVLELAGEIDLARSEEIVTRGERLLDESAAGQPVVVDLARVQFIDSSGLSALLRLRRLALARGRSVVLRDVPPFVARLLSLSGVDQVLPPE
jgi:anti-sigma B factor antagonist